jgi:hypothetical protein
MIRYAESRPFGKGEAAAKLKQLVAINFFLVDERERR